MNVIPDPGQVERIASVLDRLEPIPSLSALAKATAGPTNPNWPDDLAVGLDTGAMFKMADASRADIVDFLVLRHVGPLLIPGQVVQEFWNGALGAIQTISSSLRKKYEALAVDISKVQLGFPAFDERFQLLLDDFSASYGVLYDPGTAARIGTLLQGILQSAIVPYVPRSRFYAIAEVRDRTRTPPGFKDSGHGDFYVWADYLLGLLSAGDTTFSRAVLVTEDTKVDWSRNGVAHPILTAEVEALANVSFDVWTVDQLAAYVAERTNPAN